jgi:phosphomethylpyrimidine synthase
MKISGEIREFAATQGLNAPEEAIEEGMRAKAAEFRQKGAQIYS